MILVPQVKSCQSVEEYLKHLEEVLTRLRNAVLTAKLSKCQFPMQQCDYLGHAVGGGTVRPELSEVEAMKSFPTPQTKKQVRAFLGLTGYYRRFIPDFEHPSPLTDLTKKSVDS